MDETPDLLHADRRARALLLVELAAVCMLHGARVGLEPLDGICVTLERGPIRFEWWWEWRYASARLEAGAARPRARHAEATPAQWGEALRDLGRLLADDAFHAALAVCLTRIRPDYGAQLRRYFERQSEDTDWRDRFAQRG